MTRTGAAFCGALLVALALASPSCSSPMPCPDAGTCGTGGGAGGGGTGGGTNTCAQTCGGCCDASGACVAGKDVASCGISGSACVACGSGQGCLFGKCRAVSCSTCFGPGGSCLPAVSDTQCGKSGYACADCTAQGSTCSDAGMCKGGACGGCRDPLGICLSGADRPSCGAGGAMCTACGANEACVSGACVDAGSPGTGGGGGGSAGGGVPATDCPPDHSEDPGIASGDVKYIVSAAVMHGWAMAWLRDAGGSKLIELAFISPNGAVDPNTIKTVVNAGSDEVYSLSLAASGSGFALVYSSGPPSMGRQGYLQRLDASGNGVGAPVPFPNPTQKQDATSVVWNPLDSQWGVVWRDGIFSAEPKFARYDTSGAPVGAPVPLPAGLLSYSPIAWAGQGYAVVTAYSGEVQLSLVSRQGVITSSRILPSSVFANQVTIASSGTDLAVTFMDDTRGGAYANVHIRFARISLAGATLSDFALSSPPVTLLGVSPGNVTWSGNAYGVTWSDTVGGHESTFRAQVGAGDAVTGRIRLSCPATEDDFAPQIRASGGAHFVTFLRYDGTTRRPRTHTF